ncbi:MAG TPA: restriction endonuclease subunit S [Candidatus Luteimonas excrementigallinarum]|nr:restriction endonuclease subunit S [Candidatus Luteimonas excrementigallinarum]
MSLPRYAEYRDSGVEWLGEIPGHWLTSKLKWSSSVFSGRNSKSDTGNYPLFGANGPIGKCEIATFLKPHVLIGRVGSAGAVNYAEGSYGASDNVLVVREYSVLVPRFLYYSLIARNFDIDVSTTAQPLLTASQVKDQVVQLPSEFEQHAIAIFLDDQSSRINALIAEQQTLLALLAEKRQATISHAVTRGLDPNVPMKDSGIPWLGEVPSHWDVLSLKRDLAFLTSGSRGWAAHYADDGALFLRIGNLTRNSAKLDLSDIQRVAQPSGTEGERTRVQAGDLLFSITAYLGSVAVVPADLEAAFVSQHVALARLHGEHFLPLWVAYATLSRLGSTYLANQGYGGAKIQLSLDDIGGLPITGPPLPEQQAILDFLEVELQRFDGIIAEVNAAIRLLCERRSALISATVTGQFDVRGLSNKLVA